MARRASTSRSSLPKSDSTASTASTSVKRSRKATLPPEPLRVPTTTIASGKTSPFGLALSKLTADHSFRNRDGFSISGIGNCAAQQLFGIAGFERTNKPPGRTLLTWRLGNLVEAEIYWLMEVAAGLTVVGKQKQLAGSEPPREGHIDGYILLDGKLWLFDAKSANARSFDEWLGAAGQSKWQAMKDGVARFDPTEIADPSYRAVKQVYESYYMQALGYLELINNRDEYKSYRIDNMADVPQALADAAVDGAVPVATEGMFFYVYCKDDSRLYEEFVPYDAEPVESRLGKLNHGFRRVDELKSSMHIEPQMVELIREYQEVPLKEDGTKHWKCVRCPFVEICRP